MVKVACLCLTGPCASTVLRLHASATLPAPPAGISKWAEIENSCPFCKQRFARLRRKRLAPRAALAGLDAAAQLPGVYLDTHEVEQRNQVGTRSSLRLYSWVCPRSLVPRPCRTHRKCGRTARPRAFPSVQGCCPPARHIHAPVQGQKPCCRPPCSTCARAHTHTHTHACTQRPTANSRPRPRPTAAPAAGPAAAARGV